MYFSKTIYEYIQQITRKQFQRYKDILLESDHFGKSANVNMKNTHFELSKASVIADCRGEFLLVIMLAYR